MDGENHYRNKQTTGTHMKIGFWEFTYSMTRNSVREPCV